MDGRRVALVMAIVGLGLALVGLVGYGHALGSVGGAGALAGPPGAVRGIASRSDAAGAERIDEPRPAPPREGSALRDGRRRWLMPLALMLAVLTLGPIKRAFGFDRATPLALVLWPALVVAGHLAFGALNRPAIALGHVGVALLGALSALVVFGIGRARTRPSSITGTRRVAACVGWSAFVSALFTSFWGGLAFDGLLASVEGRGTLLALGAAAPALLLMSVVLFVSVGRDRG